MPTKTPDFDADQRTDPIAFWGVRGKLLLAFLAVAMFSVLAAATGIYSITQVGKSFDQITERRVPEALAWQELSRSIERVVRGAPALLAVDNETDRKIVSDEVFSQMETLKILLADARQYGELDDEPYLLDGAINTSVAADRAVELVERIDDNFLSINQFVVDRLQLIQSKKKVQTRLARGNANAQRTLLPSSRVLGSQLSEWRNDASENADTDLTPEQQELARSIIAFYPEQQAAVLFDAFNRQIFLISEASTIEQVELLSFPLERIHTDILQLLPDIRTRVRGRLEKQLDVLLRLTQGPEGLPEIRKAELMAITQAEELLGLNTRLSTFLTNRSATLVDAANQRISVANLEAVGTRLQNRNILIAVVLLSIVSSLLIVWLYVSRNLTARLSALSNSMLAIADGNLKTPLPPVMGHDEITLMAEALVGFRDTAVEVEESNLREIATARQRLVDAIESINEGFAFYDADDRLVLSNQRYKDLLYDGIDVDLTPGLTFETILRNAVKTGMIEEARLDPEEWLERRLERHREPGQPLLQQRKDNRWVMVSERKVAGGGSVAIYSDLTELKQREDQLSHANTQILSSVHYASRIQEAMLPSRKALSNMLPDHFLIWEPRDIVGGDFFWCHETDHGAYVIVGDCTGHGVPGAFMTLIACGLIDRHLRTNDEMLPGALLSALHADLQQLLGQNEDNTETDDGLEAGVCFIDKANQRMTFAGSRFSLFISNSTGIDEVKGDKAGIGYNRYSHDTQFTNIDVKLEPACRYILATDGLFDQIGGAKRRGFGKVRLRDFIAASGTTRTAEQGDRLREAFAAFQGDEYRRDDLTVLGFEIS